MDNKITRKRLEVFITYDLFKVVILAVILCVVLSLVFNFVGKRPTEGQRFCVLYSDDINVQEEGSNLAYVPRSVETENLGYSYEVLDLKSQSLTLAYNYTNQKLNFHVEINEDDVFICGDETAKFYVESGYAEDILSYLNNAFKFLEDNGIYTNIVKSSGTVNATYNEQAVEAYYKKVHKRKDARLRYYSLESLLEAEKLRMRAIYDNASMLYKLLTDHPELLVTNYEFLETSGNYALDLSKLTGKRSIENAFTVIKKNEDGTVDYTTDGLRLLIGNNSVDNGDNHYESLVYILTLVKTYSDFLD